MDLKQVAEEMLSVYEPASLLLRSKFTHSSKGYQNSSGYYIGSNPKKLAKRRKRNKNRKTHRRK